MRAAVLLYHSQNIRGSGYALNDHVALATDLAMLRHRRIRVVPLQALVDAVRHQDLARFPDGCVALTCDDGTCLDWEDYLHPRYGWQPSFDRILQEHMRKSSTHERGLLTSFVIASPQARAIIDEDCYGRPLSDSHWWLDAARSGRVVLGNHSWDHVHECVIARMNVANRPPPFNEISDESEADRQIAQASDYLDKVLIDAQTRVNLLAFPYGHHTDFLTDCYLPNAFERHRIEAAFTTVPEFVTPSSNPYRLPRFVCGSAWRTPAAFARLMSELRAPA